MWIMSDMISPFSLSAIIIVPVKNYTLNERKLFNIGDTAIFHEKKTWLSEEG